MLDDIYKALPPWGQGLHTLLVVGMGVGASLFGLRKKPDERHVQQVSDDPMKIPIWVMMGPIHEVIQTIHDMAENQRNMYAELQRISAATMDGTRELDNMNRGQEYTHRLLEEILRHNDMTPPPAPYQPSGTLKTRSK